MTGKTAKERQAERTQRLIGEGLTKTCFWLTEEEAATMRAAFAKLKKKRQPKQPKESK